MSIAIKKEKCAGCRKCTSVCPGSLIKTDEDGKAYIKYPRDCWGCASCLKECKFGAIEFYLGADIGGIGSKMHVTEDGDIYHWHIKKVTGETETITINKKDSNQY
ncbi:MAG TPA: adenylylsulfate reductase [Lachnospiraceae bacterium]|nr:ferredoxin family protein [uncultured Lachnoclostridium sp.]HAU84507.1 adenylylsulfate reductase [Lachnospiraceae bacterium]